jgi:hypothetical protein
MVDTSVIITSEYAPKGTVAFRPSDQSVAAVLEPIEKAVVVPTEDSYTTQQEMKYADAISNLMNANVIVSEVPQIEVPEVTVIFDTETTGTDKFTSRLVVVTLWDISKPKSSMSTFSGWDEELLVTQTADWLNKVNPTRLVAYNITFDMIFLLSRFMLYKIPVPCWKTLVPYDMMDVLAKGTEKSSDKDTKVGKAEEWFFFLFGETKPYMIDECLADAENGDLTKFIIRNRVCVGSEGDMYALLQHVLTGTANTQAWEQVPLGYAVEAEAEGEYTVQCPNCLTGNVYHTNGGDQYCFLCGTLLDGSKKYNPAITHSSSELESKYVASLVPDWGKIAQDTANEVLEKTGNVLNK